MGGANEDEILHESDQLSAVNSAKELFETVKSKENLKLTGEEDYSEDGVTLEIPIIPDMYGADPLEICLRLNNKRDVESAIFKTTDENMAIIMEAENIALANVIFSNLKDYGLLSCSSYIHDPIISAIEKGLSSIGEYLESRLLVTEHSFSAQKA